VEEMQKHTVEVLKVSAHTLADAVPAASSSIFTSQHLAPVSLKLVLQSDWPQDEAEADEEHARTKTA
jgi:hypothetical protein